MSAPEDERLARVVLSRVVEPGDVRTTGLAAELGATRLLEVLRADDTDHTLLTDLESRAGPVDPVRELERAARLGIRFVIPGDAEWPAGLEDLAWAQPVQERGGVPLGLWVKGEMRLDELAGSLAIVGSRTATSYGGAVAAELAAAGARAGVPVVSGAAYGIDQAGHRGALAAGGRTVAVLACGVDRPYPSGHKVLLDHIRNAGAVVSEAPVGWAPMRVRFLARNRLIAALTRATVVVEAALRSGALNTANWATRLNRTLLGVPGPVTSAPSQGVHQLIRSGAAGLVTSGEEVLESLGSAGAHLLTDPRGPERPRDRLTTRQQQVLDAVPVSRGASTDSIARAAGVGIREVHGALLRLQHWGFVRLDPVGWRLADQAHR
ncbi:DNA-processing protein DprA [Nocardioides ferulae]|uniref:DNA-processing protein DprA n=1 Tax=Nocardioides ferulae TaxID=2340821 RepID=UPI000EB1EA51|nr:DNA-processing protein DprA [Nocardioides ferulae]